MAVGLEYLGQQVRCPHCGGIVIAPREAPVPTSNPSQPPFFGGEEAHASEDIFSETPPSDSLFDDEPMPPPSYPSPSVSPFDEPYNTPSRLEDLAPEPAPPPPQPQPQPEREWPSTPAPAPPTDLGGPIPSLSLDDAKPGGTGFAAIPDALAAEEEVMPVAEVYRNGKATGPPVENVPATLPYAPEGASSAAVPAAWGVAPTPTPAAPPPSAPAPMEPLPLPVSPAYQQPFTPDPPAPRERTSSSRGGIGLFIPLFVMPLILYAIGMTLAAGFLYMRLTSVPPNANPFEQMPDVDGDDPGVKMKKLTLRFGKQDALAELPPRQVIALKETLQMGDLEITPLKVERRTVRIFDERQGKDGEPEPLPSAPLVLTLRVKNCAADYRFTPMDNFFDRHWNGKSGSTPLTILQAGGQNFFGGPAKWFPQKREGKRRDYREWLEGRSNGDPQGLGPGESTETLVCSDGGDEPTVKYLFGESLDGRKVGKPYSGNLVWRVQLRRGLITIAGKRYPATCVVGIRFTSRDYLKG
jgi:hypothetical protein